MDTFPSYRYGPGGKAEVFQSADDVPPGWVDHPSKLKDAKAPEEATERRAGRAELMEQLRQRGIQYAPNAGGAELAALLAASEKQPVEVDANGKVLGVGNDLDELVAGNAVEVIAAIGPDTDLDALEAAEKDREVPRKGVLAAIGKAREVRK
jgi:hypothetical protein